MKIVIITAMLLLAATVSFAEPVWMAKPYTVSAQQVQSGSSSVLRYTITFSDERDMWPEDSVSFCPDKLRASCSNNVPLAAVKKEGLTEVFDVPMEMVSAGQSGINFTKDKFWQDTLWMGLPTNNIQLSSNLVCANSVKDANIPYSGGTYILYVGPGAPYVPAPGEKGLDNGPVIVPCGGGARQIAAAPPIGRKAPCPPSRGGGSVSGNRDSAVAVASGPSSMSAAAKDSAQSQVKAGNVEVHAKHVKGGVHVRNEAKTQVYAPSSRGANIRIKGGVKGSNNNIGCTYIYNNGNQQLGDGNINGCVKCHDEKVWGAFRPKHDPKDPPKAAPPAQGPYTTHTQPAAKAAKGAK